MLTECDDEGRCLWLPKRLCGALYPHDEDVTPAMLKVWADECASRDMAVIYETDAGPVYAVRNWSKHQKISHPTPSRLNAPPKSSGKSPEKFQKAPESLRPEREREREVEQGEKKPPDGGAEVPKFEDPKSLIWKTGVSLLTSSSGCSEEAARRFLGQFAKREVKLAEVIGYLAANPKVEPKAYIVAALTKKSGAQEFAEEVNAGF